MSSEKPSHFPDFPNESRAPKIDSKPTYRKIESYQMHAILCLIFCCFPAAIPALLYSWEVQKQVARGNYGQAERASKNARLWCIISVVGGVLALIAYVTARSMP